MTQVRMLKSDKIEHPAIVDVTRLMDLAPDLQIDVDEILSEGIFGCGVKGAGKTSTARRIAEEFGKFSIPMVIFDFEGDWMPIVKELPRGYAASVLNCPTGQDVLRNGLQVVYDMSSWPTDVLGACSMMHTVNQLLQYATSLPVQERVPCLVFLDEASRWLPEQRPEALDKVVYSALIETFQNLVERGRKRGIIPCLFCQRISEIKKTIMAQSGVHILMRQTAHPDLALYMKYLTPLGDLTATQFQARIRAFGPGKGVIRLPDGRQLVRTFHKSKSEHLSHTPSALAALNRFGSMPFDPSRKFAACSDIPEEKPEMPAPIKMSKKARELYDNDGEPLPRKVTAKAPAKKKTVTRTRAPRKVSAIMKEPGFFDLTGVERARRLLAVDPNLRTVELANFAKCDVGSASKLRSKLSNK